MSVELAVRFLEHITQDRDSAGQPQQFDTTSLTGLRDIRASPGRVTAVLPVGPAVSNRYGTLHGGCIATLVDTVGSAALVTVSPKGGVSLNINVNYLSKMPVGGNVLVEAQVVKVGKTIATIDVQLKEQGTGTVVAQGTHIKFMAEKEPTMAEIIEQAKLQQQQKQRHVAGSTAAQQGAGVRSRL